MNILKNNTKKEFETTIVSAVYTVLLAWRSYTSSKQQDENATQPLETSQKLDVRTSKILEVCERLEARSSTKHSSFFGRFASAFWWDKTEKGKAGGVSLGMVKIIECLFVICLINSGFCLIKQITKSSTFCHLHPSQTNPHQPCPSQSCPTKRQRQIVQTKKNA